MELLLLTLAPVTAMVLGALAAGLRRPSRRVSSAVQHLAAGVVFAAVAAELLPQIKQSGAPVPVAVGFLLGVATVLAVKLGFAERGVLLAVGVDVLLDGVLVGIGFMAGAREGLLLTVALTLEVLFLGLSTAATLAGRGLPPARTVGTVAALALAIPAGAFLGSGLLSRVPGSVYVGVLAFGAAALLYLVTEELLVEAHEQDDAPVLGAFFFLGFLAILMLEMLG